MPFEHIAARIGARDIFVMCSLDDARLFNLDGHGRGAGWAGNITVHESDEPMLHRALEGRISRRTSGVPFRAFGPYWTERIAIVPVPGGVVAFGGASVTDDDDALMTAAARAMDATDNVPKEKAAADRAELEQAVASLRGGGSSIAETASGIAAAAARALSCEFAAVLLSGDPPRLYMADEGWRPAATDEEIIAALLPLHQAAADGLLVEQDLSLSPFPYPPLSLEDGLVARCAVPLGERGELGVLVVAHAGTTPRGFTTLCQRVATGIGARAGEMLVRELAAD